MERSNSEEKEIDIDRMLSECGAGYTITVKRIRPTWCAGTLDKFDADPDNPINILDLKEVYGGRQLKITIRDSNGLYKGSRVLQFPCGPREEGRPIEPDDMPGKGANQLDAVRDMAKLFLDSQKATSEAVTGILKGRIESLEAQITNKLEPTAAAPKKAATTPIEVIRESIETMKEIENLRNTFGDNNKGEQGGGMVEQMIEQYFQMQMDKEKDKIANATKADRSEPPPDLPQRDHPAAHAAQAANAQAANAQAANAQAANAQRQVYADDIDEIVTRDRTVDEMDDMELAIVMRERWAKLPKDQQEIALNIFMGNYTMEDLEPEPVDDQEEEEEDERGGIDISRPDPDGEVESIMSGVSLTDDDERTLESEGEDPSVPSSGPNHGPISPDSNVS